MQFQCYFRKRSKSAVSIREDRLVLDLENLSNWLMYFFFFTLVDSFFIFAEKILIMQFLYLFRYAITKAFCVAFFMTFLSMFDVPVFWPILFFYWFFLFFLTMKRLITHMIKYRYVPFNLGKQVIAFSL